MKFEIAEVYGDQVIKLYYKLYHSDEHGHGLWFAGSKWTYTGLSKDGDKYSAEEAEPELLRSALVALFEQEDISTMLKQMNEFEANNGTK